MYAGTVGDDPSGATFHSGVRAARRRRCPSSTSFTSRHWFEHLDDPYDFLGDLREQAGERTVYGYIEVPDAGYDLSTAGWEVIYPHVSYFDAFSLATIVERAGWRVEDGGTLFGGMFRFIEFSANAAPAASRERAAAAARRPRPSAGGDRRRSPHRHHAEREAWRVRLAELDDAGARPVLWGAGSRGVQFLTFADPDRHLAAVVDVNPRKWGRYLPITAHRVDAAGVAHGAAAAGGHHHQPVVPRRDRSRALRELGVDAELLVA